MNDDRSLERAARSWLEGGPTLAPDRAVDAALARIQTTRQERGLRIPWRFPTMNPLTRIAVVAAVLAVAVGSALIIFRPVSQVGPQATPTAPPATIEGTWEVSFTRQEMLAAGIVDQLEDNADNYGQFHLTFQAGWWTMPHLAPKTGGGGTATYTVDSAVAHLYSPEDNITFDMPYTVTATSLTFGHGGPVSFRVKPWTRVATELITATPYPADIAAYRQARNDACATLHLVSMPPDADPVTNGSGAIAALNAVIAQANREITALSGLVVPAELKAEHEANIQSIRDTLPLLQQEIDLINQGKAEQVAAVDAQTGPLNATFEAFEQKYNLNSC